jgi:GxxExxY protein
VRTGTKIALEHSRLTEKVIGAFYDVYNHFGPGFLESVYQRSMQIALQEIGIKADIEVPIPVFFHGQSVGEFRADMVIENTILIELKVARGLDPAHEAQVIHYLRSTALEVALLFNFGAKAEFKRFYLANSNKLIRAISEISGKVL